MGIFSKALIQGLFGGGYKCPDCEAEMELEDGDTLVCPKCGYSCDLDRYGMSDEEYDALYPVREEDDDWDEDEDNDYGEYYDEEVNELSHDD